MNTFMLASAILSVVLIEPFAFSLPYSSYYPSKYPNPSKYSPYSPYTGDAALPTGYGSPSSYGPSSSNYGLPSTSSYGIPSTYNPSPSYNQITPTTYGLGASSPITPVTYGGTGGYNNYNNKYSSSNYAPTGTYSIPSFLCTPMCPSQNQYNPNYGGSPSGYGVSSGYNPSGYNPSGYSGISSGYNPSGYNPSYPTNQYGAGSSLYGNGYAGGATDGFNTGFGPIPGNAGIGMNAAGAPTFYPSSNLARRDSEKPSDIRPDLVDNKEQNKVQIENLKAAKTAKKQR